MAVLGLAGYVSISEGRRKRKQSWWDLGKDPRSHLSGGAGITREPAVPDSQGCSCCSGDVPGRASCGFGMTVKIGVMVSDCTQGLDLT